MSKRVKTSRKQDKGIEERVAKMSNQGGEGVVEQALAEYDRITSSAPALPFGIHRPHMIFGNIHDGVCRPLDLDWSKGEVAVALAALKSKYTLSVRCKEVHAICQVAAFGRLVKHPFGGGYNTNLGALLFWDASEDEEETSDD